MKCIGCSEDELDYYWDDLVRSADTNNDGKISKDEFVGYTLGDEPLETNGTLKDKEQEEKLRAQLMAVGPGSQMINRLFMLLDHNSNLVLEEDEGK